MHTGIIKFEKFLLVTIFLGILCTMFLQILLRNLNIGGLPYVDQILPHTLVWIMQLGTLLGLESKKHLRFEWLFREKNPLWADYVRALIGFASFLALFVVSTVYVKNEIQDFGTMGYLSISYPIFFFLAFLQIILVRRI